MAFVGSKRKGNCWRRSTWSKESLQDIILFKFCITTVIPTRANLSSLFLSGKAKVQIHFVHFHLKLLELKVKMFPPQLSPARTEGRVYKCSSMLKYKNNTNPPDDGTGTIQGSTKVNDLESNNFSFAAGANMGIWGAWCTRFYPPDHSRKISVRNRQDFMYEDNQQNERIFNTRLYFFCIVLYF